MWTRRFFASRLTGRRPLNITNLENEPSGWYFGIKSEYVDLCKALGTRIKCLNGCPANLWRLKYMFKVLHIITAQNGSLVTAVLFSDDPDIIKNLKNEYDEIVQKRREKLAGPPRHKNWNKYPFQIMSSLIRFVSLLRFIRCRQRERLRACLRMVWVSA